MCMYVIYVEYTIVCIRLDLDTVLPHSFLPLFHCCLLQCLHDVPAVREAAAEALGTALKVVGERRMAAYLEGLESLKMNRVRSCYTLLCNRMPCDHHVMWALYNCMHFYIKSYVQRLSHSEYPKLFRYIVTFDMQNGPYHSICTCACEY